MQAKSKYFSQAFVYALIASVVVILSTLIGASFIGFNAPSDVASQIATETESQAATTTWYYIFFNNFGLTLIGFVPFFGFAFEMFLEFNTGYAFGALSQVYHVSNVLAVLVTLATPVGVLEYVSYFFASAESLILAYSATRGELRNRFVNHSWKTILFVAVLLFISAIVEAAMIGRL